MYRQQGTDRRTLLGASAFSAALAEGTAKAAQPSCNFKKAQAQQLFK